jgi:hypothetical protein
LLVDLHYLTQAHEVLEYAYIWIPTEAGDDAAPRQEPAVAPTPAVFRGLTAPARNVMARAIREARRQEHDFVGTEHLLFALVCERGGVIGPVLQSLRADPDRVLAHINESFQEIAPSAALDRYPLTPSGRRVLRWAAGEATAMERSFIGPEHLFLALLCEADCTASQILAGQGVGYAAAAVAVRQHMFATAEDVQIQKGDRPLLPPVPDTASADLQDYFVKINTYDEMIEADAPEAPPSFRTPPNTAVAQAPLPRLQPQDAHCADDQSETLAPYADWDDFRSNSPAVRRALQDLLTRKLPNIDALGVEPVPREAALRTAQLGRHPLTLLRASGNARGVFYDLGVVMLLAIFVFMAVLLVRMDLHHFDWRRVFSFCPVFAIAFAVFMGIWLLRSGRWHESAFWIFENGILQQHRGKFVACRWGDVQDFTWENLRDLQAQAVLVFRLGLYDEPATSITAQTMGAKAAADYIESKVTSARFLPTLRRIFEGETIRWGIFHVDRAGLYTHPERRVAWSNVTEVELHAVVVSLVLDGRQKFFRYHDVPFPTLFAVIAQVLIAEHARLVPNEA